MSLTIVSGRLDHRRLSISSRNITLVSTAYNFTGSGAGAYSIQPSTLFTFVGADGTLNDLDATVEHVEVDLSGTLAVSRTFDKRATFNGCSATQQSQINSATSGAQKYAASALAYISGVSSATTRYTSWFGVYDAGRKATVQSHYTSISSHQYSSFTYDCTCTDSNTYAYVCAYIFQPRVFNHSRPLNEGFSSIRSRPIWKDLPLWCLLEGP